MKKRLSDLSEQEQKTTLEALFGVLQKTERTQVKELVKDMLTKSEQIMLGRRILIARMLLEGDGYDSITKKMGVGKNTIRTIDKWLFDCGATTKALLK